MATVKPVVEWGVAGDPNVVRYTWPNLASGDEGEPTGAQFLQYVDRVMQVTGTPSGATVAGQGSADGVNFAALTIPAGTALSFTAAGIKQVVEGPVLFKPVVTGGDGNTDITVTLLARRI